MALSVVVSASLAVVQKASPEAKAKTRAKTLLKTKQKAKKKSRFSNTKEKVRQDAVLQNLKYKMTIKSIKTAPQPEDVHPSQQY